MILEFSLSGPTICGGVIWLDVHCQRAGEFLIQTTHLRRRKKQIKIYCFEGVWGVGKDSVLNISIYIYVYMGITFDFQREHLGTVGRVP